MVNLILVRHGETNSNKIKTIMGHSNHHLNSDGIKQAEICGRYLAKYYPKISMIYSSTLLRAMETLDIIVKHLGENLAIQYLPELSERSFGNLEGQSMDSILPKLSNKQGEYDITVRPPNGESGLDFYKRVSLGIKNIIMAKSWEKDESILLVTHGGTIRHILGFFLLPKDKKYNNFPIDPKNCSLTSVNVYNDEIIVNYINFYQYLSIEG